MKCLERSGFAVSKVYFYENDSRFLGYPFIIMDKLEAAKERVDDFVDRFAETMSRLHNLEICELGLDVLKLPPDGYAFARRWPVHFRNYLSFETKHSKRLKRAIDLGIYWLDLNVAKNYCPRYSLIHGDSHPQMLF